MKRSPEDAPNPANQRQMDHHEPREERAVSEERTLCEDGCAVCGKPLGSRRVQQGVRVHPRCRRSGIDRHSFERAMVQTEQALQRLGGRKLENRELGTLFEAATEEAQVLVSHLRRMKDYFDPQTPRVKAPRPQEPAKDPTVEAAAEHARLPDAKSAAARPEQSARERWGTPTTPAWALSAGPKPPPERALSADGDRETPQLDAAKPASDRLQTRTKPKKDRRSAKRIRGRRRRSMRESS